VAPAKPDTLSGDEIDPETAGSSRDTLKVNLKEKGLNNQRIIQTKNTVTKHVTQAKMKQAAKNATNAENEENVPETTQEEAGEGKFHFARVSQDESDC
jgi:hypothetical protein